MDFEDAHIVLLLLSLPPSPPPPDFNFTSVWVGLGL